MSEEGGPPPLKRVKLSMEEVQTLTKEEILEKWQEQEAFIEALLTKYRPPEVDEVIGLRESEEKLKLQQIEATRRENVLVMRLTAKEQEMQDYVNQIQELKQAQTTSAAQLRTMLLDPAINIMFQRMKKEMDANKEKLEQAQNDLAAWKFTPDSQTGKRLMAKCRMLLQENEELGKVISSGRTAKLEGEIALEKTLVQEMKKSQAEMDEFLLELDEDVEGMQSTIYLLQQQLKESKEQISQLQGENEHLRGQCNKYAVTNSVKGQHDSNRSTPTLNKTDTYTEQDERERTHHDEIPLSPKAEYRTSRQSNNSPCEVVSNHKRDHQQLGSKQDHSQTSKPKNGGHEHAAMETDTNDDIRESCDEDRHSSPRQEHSKHRQFNLSHPETTNSSSNNRGEGKEVNNHQNTLTGDRDTNSDGDFVITENTDATSSEGWSPNQADIQSEEVEMDDETSSQASDTAIRTGLKGRTVGGIGGSDDKQTLLHNGLVGSIQYDSQDDDQV